MESDDLKRLWRCETSEAAAGHALPREELMGLVIERTNEVSANMRRRLRQEAGSYLIILAVVLPWMVYPFRMRSSVLGAGFMVVVAGIMATLHWGSRRLAALEMEGSVHEVVRRTLKVVDTTMRAYLFGYIACIGLGLAVVTGMVMRRHPWDLVWIAPMLLLTVGGAAWGYWSGLGYLEGRFGADRTRLATCLAELEGGH